LPERVKVELLGAEVNANGIDKEVPFAPLIIIVSFDRFIIPERGYDTFTPVNVVVVALKIFVPVKVKFINLLFKESYFNKSPFLTIVL
jgi:hypothetical protein